MGVASQTIAVRWVQSVKQKAGCSRVGEGAGQGTMTITLGSFGVVGAEWLMKTRFCKSCRVVRFVNIGTEISVVLGHNPGTQP